MQIHIIYNLNKYEERIMFKLPRANTEDLPIDMDKLNNVGVYQASYIKTNQLVFNEWAIKACEANRCGKYNSNWACPPGLGSIEENEARCRAYDHGFVFNGKYPLKRETDFRGMMKANEDFNEMNYELDDLIGKYLDDYLLMSVGDCSYCKECAYPEECRFPNRMYPAVEGMGINVSDLARNAGISYSEDPLSIIYLGLVLYR